MTEDDRQRVLDEAYATLERLRDFEVEPRPHHEPLRDEDRYERARERLERQRASMPAHEPKLDTYVGDWSAVVDARIAEAIAEERERERPSTFSPK